MLREIVLSKEEFHDLSRGRVHWVIEQEPVKASNVAGTGVIQTGDYYITVSVTALSKDKDPLRIIVMKIALGMICPYNKEECKEKLAEIREAAIEQFPDATEGVFE